jgi:hypothetical protein
LKSLTYWLGAVWRARLTRAFETTDHFYMPTTAGDHDWERVTASLAPLGGSTVEVGLHPGADDLWRRRELASLELFVSAAATAGHELINWRAIGTG